MFNVEHTTIQSDHLPYSNWGLKFYLHQTNGGGPAFEILGGTGQRRHSLAAFLDRAIRSSRTQLGQILVIEWRSSTIK